MVNRDKPTHPVVRWTLLLLIVMAVALAAVGLLLRRSHENPQARLCSFNLKQIQQAKLAWARQTKAPDTEIPKDTDLFGPERELKEKPVCPTGGVYTIGKLTETPKCSIASHTEAGGP